MSHESRPGQSSSATPDKSGEIKQAIDQTRSAISEDIKSIGDKFDPDVLKASAQEIVREAKDGAREVIQDARTEATGMLRDAKHAAVGSLREAKEHAVGAVSSTVQELGHSIRTAGRTTGDFVAVNAVPLSLIGLGVGWLWMSTRQSARQTRSAHGPSLAGRFERQPDVEPRAGSLNVPGRAAELGHDAAKRARELSVEAREKVGELTDRALEQVDSARRSAEEASIALTRRAAELGHEVGSRFDQAQEATRQYADDSPLALGALALAAGVGVAFLLPSSESEDRLLGPRRDQLIREARGAASKVGQVATNAASELRRELSE